MLYSVDFEDIFRRLPDPIAICDEEGYVRTLNDAASRFLGPTPGKRLRLVLTARDTVRHMRLDQGSQEFLMAEVQVENAKRRHVSISLLELPDGGYRVAFVGGSTATSPSIRILESVLNINRHLPLFKTADKVVALFASSFSEVFPEYAFSLHLDAPYAASYQHAGWSDAEPQQDSRDADAGHVLEPDMIWSGAKRGYRLDLSEIGGVDGYFQVERATDKKFAVEEREAFESFAQQLASAVVRLRVRHDDVSVVAPIIDQLDAVVIVCDARRRIRVANRTFEAIVGDQRVVGRDILDFFSEGSGMKLRTIAAAVMGGGGVETFDAALTSRGGDSTSQVILKIQVAPNRVNDGPTASSSGFIITGQKSEMSIVELEERLSRAEHLMNLGQLATGVAHELKNPLTSILNYAEYLLRKYDESVFEDRDRVRLQRIIQGVEHIDAFVGDLMTLARPDEGDWVVVDLQKVVKESAAMCEVVLQSKNARLLFDFGPPKIVYGSRGQLCQVFVNLMTNSVNAMGDEGGVLHIRTEVLDGFVVCSVEDDAGGIPSEVVDRVFEPFFTTRDSTGGTGLGLAIVKEIVNRHRGRIEVESQQGSGTTFKIWIPENV